MKVFCEQCGSGFIARTAQINLGNARFCSRTCYQTSRILQVTVVCISCGKKFSRKRSASLSRPFCSRSCYNVDRGVGPKMADRKCESCHKPFRSRSIDVGRGAGRYCCPQCQYDGHRRTTYNQFQDYGRTTAYRYERVVFQNAKAKVEIVCVEHGSFLQAPSQHMRGHGCPSCANRKNGQKISGPRGPNLKLQGPCLAKRLTTQEFIARALSKHGDRYGYELVQYKMSRQPVSIVCRVHGIFEQRASGHMLGQGCPKCTSKRTSARESAWLDSLGIPTLVRQFTLPPLGKFRARKADGFDPASNTVFQFHGDFWHGNPRVFRPCGWNPIKRKFYWELYEYTIRYDQAVRNAGYNLVVVWEADIRLMDGEGARDEASGQ